jgi:GNAT superfamily N-acetyltransferase
MPLTLRPLTSADFATVDSLLMAAYERPSSMLDDLAHYLRQQPDGWFLALLDGAAVGMGGAITYGTFARIGLMAVHPDFQRQGIGLALMQHLLNWIAAHGATTILLDATPAGAPLYAQLGFVTDDHACAYGQSRPILPTEMPASGGTLLQPSDFSEVVAFDAERFGASRSGILAMYQGEFPGRAFVARDREGKVAGYLIAQKQRIGPWLADTPEAAEALLCQALSLFSGSASVLVPEHNLAARALLERFGFTPGRRWQSMRRGGISELQRRQWLYGYANFYFG